MKLGKMGSGEEGTVRVKMVRWSWALGTGGWPITPQMPRVFTLQASNTSIEA